jgi:hypothetical protein
MKTLPKATHAYSLNIDTIFVNRLKIGTVSLVLISLSVLYSS